MQELSREADRVWYSFFSVCWGDAGSSPASDTLKQSPSSTTTSPCPLSAPCLTLTPLTVARRRVRRRRRSRVARLGCPRPLHHPAGRLRGRSGGRRGGRGRAAAGRLTLLLRRRENVLQVGLPAAGVQVVRGSLREVPR